jgi:hypothetical protein
MYLAWENRTINSYYEELYKSYNTLAKKYNAMYDAAIFNMTLLMPRGLDEHYESIRIYESNKFSNKGEQGWLLFYVTQVLHDLGNYSYSPHCTNFNESVGIECKNLTVSFAIDFLDYINRSYSNISRIEQVYNWVNQFVSYVHDANEFSRFPIETLVNRFGDCEDQAMVLSFLLETCGYETALCMINDGNLTKYGPEGLHHVFCAVSKNNFEYNGTFIQLHEYPEYGKIWIVLDPAFGHQFGRDPEWLGNYRMDNGTVYIPPVVLDALLVDSTELVAWAEKIGIELNKCCTR